MIPKWIENRQQTADDFRRKEAGQAIVRAAESIERLLEVPYIGQLLTHNRAADTFLKSLIDSIVRLSYRLLSGKKEIKAASREVMLNRAQTVGAIDDEIMCTLRKALYNSRNATDCVEAVKMLCHRLELILDDPDWKSGRDFTEAQRFYTASRWYEKPKQRRPRPKQLISPQT